MQRSWANDPTTDSSSRIIPKKVFPPYRIKNSSLWCAFFLSHRRSFELFFVLSHSLSWKISSLTWTNILEFYLPHPHTHTHTRHVSSTFKFLAVIAYRRRKVFFFNHLSCSPFPQNKFKFSSLFLFSFFSHKFLIFLKASCQSTRWHFGKGEDVNKTRIIDWISIFILQPWSSNVPCIPTENSGPRKIGSYYEVNFECLFRRNYSGTKTCRECDGLSSIKDLKSLLRSLAGPEADERLASGHRLWERRRHSTAGPSDH